MARRGADRQGVLRALEGHHDELTGFLFTGREEAGYKQDSVPRTANYPRNSTGCRLSQKSSRARAGELALPVGSAHGHYVKQCYAARMTVPTLSFLPKRRRMVRGLI